MAVKLRLMRMGKKKQPTYRVVAADARSPRNGRFIEIVGTYEPRRDPSLIQIDNERAVHWLRHGAQPTERVEKLLRISGAWSDFTGEERPAVVTRAASATDAPAEAEAPEAATAEADTATDATAEAQAAEAETETSEAEVAPAEASTETAATETGTAEAETPPAEASADSEAAGDGTSEVADEDQT